MNCEGDFTYSCGGMCTPDSRTCLEIALDTMKEAKDLAVTLFAPATLAADWPILLSDSLGLTVDLLNDS